jgi:hypothetical protein
MCVAASAATLCTSNFVGAEAPTFLIYECKFLYDRW